jgi:hypothetical protein
VRQSEKWPFGIGVVQAKSDKSLAKQIPKKHHEQSEPTQGPARRALQAASGNARWVKKLKPSTNQSPRQASHSRA